MRSKPPKSIRDDSDRYSETHDELVTLWQDNKHAELGNAFVRQSLGAVRQPFRLYPPERGRDEDDEDRAWLSFLYSTYLYAQKGDTPLSIRIGTLTNEIKRQYDSSRLLAEEWEERQRFGPRFYMENGDVSSQNPFQDCWYGVAMDFSQNDLKLTSFSLRQLHDLWIEKIDAGLNGDKDEEF